MHGIARLLSLCFFTVGAYVAIAADKTAEPAPAKIAGRWDFTVDTSAGSGNPVFTFKQEGAALTGTYDGAFGISPLTGSVYGNTVRFTFTVDADGAKTLVEYEGTITGKTMKGTVKIGSLGEGTFTAVFAKPE
jgi:hypothetical protein